MYILCGNKRTNYYLKVRDMRVRLISCLLDSNRNSTGEFVRVHDNWFADDIPCPFSWHKVGLYRFLTCLSFNLWFRDIRSLRWVAPSVPSNSRCQTCVLYLATFWASSFGRQSPPLLHRCTACKFSSSEVHSWRSSGPWLAVHLFRRACTSTGRVDRTCVSTPLRTSSRAC